MSADVRLAWIAILTVSIASACTCEPTEPTPTPEPPAPVAEPDEPAPEPAPEEAAPAPTPPFVSLRAGQGYTCALHREGRVLCWGTNGDGQADPRRPSMRAPPTWVEGLDDAVAIAAGMRTTCAARRSGRVACWGMNSDGQLGTSTRGERRGLAEVVGVTDAEDVLGWKGSLAMCARRRGGAIVCWGRAPSTVEGAGRAFDDLSVQPYFLDDVRSIARSGSEVCVQRTSGEVLCWTTSSLGPGSTTPTPMPELAGAVALYANDFTVFAAMPGGEVRGWTSTPSPPPALMPVGDDPHPVRPALQGAVAFAVFGWNEIFGLLTDGTVVWLDGDGARAAVAGGTDVAEIVGPDHLVALTRDGRILEWAPGAAGPSEEPSVLEIPPVEPAAAAAPTEAIPERCEVHARRAEVEHHATLESFRAGVEAEADATDAQITEALCSAAGVDPGSADCPAEGPWPGLLGFELVLVVPREAGGYDVLRRLGTESPGTESASELRGIELRARAPVAFAVEEEQSEQSCDGEGDDEICGLSMSAMSQRVVLERPDGTFVLVDVGLPLDEAFVRAQAAPTATLEGDGVRVVACGGSGLVPLED